MDLNFVLEIFLTVAALIVLVVPCFVLKKLNVVGNSAEGVLSDIVLYVCQPLMLVMSFQKTAFTAEVLLNMLIVFGLAVAIHAVMIGLIVLFTKGKGADERVRVLRFAAVFSNCGYMGIPFLQLLYGESAGELLIYAGVVIGVFNLLAWTIGVYLITGDTKSVSFKKAALNPNIIGLIIGLTLFLTVQKPLADLAPASSVAGNIVSKLIKCVTFFADMVTPLSMSVIGIKLASMPLKKLVSDKYAYLSVASKNVLMSLVAMVFVAFLPIDGTVKNAIFFTLSMPSATMTVLLTVKHGGDGDLATSCVLLSTMLSVVTVPLIYALFSLLI